MNLPNITLFLQLVHFAVAYYVLRRFIFGPALQIIVKQDNYKQSIQTKIEITRNAQQDNLKLKQSRWNFMKTSLTSLIPQISGLCFLPKKSDTSVPVQTLKLSDQEKQKIIQTLCDELSDIKS